MIELPAYRWGEPYESLDVDQVNHFYTGEPVVKLHTVGSGIIQRDAKKARAARQALRALSPAELIARCKQAGELFESGTLTVGNAAQSPQEFVQLQSATTGMPIAMCEANVKKNAFVLKNIDQILDALAGSEQTKEQDHRLAGPQAVTLTERLPVVILREMLEQPFRIAVGDDVGIPILDKGKQQEELLTVFPGVKEDRRKVPVNIRIGAQGPGGKRSAPAFPPLELMADLGERQSPPADVPQKDSLKGKMDLGELHDIRLELDHSACQPEPGRDKEQCSLTAPQGPA